MTLLPVVTAMCGTSVAQCQQQHLQPKAAASSNSHSPYEQNPGPGMSTPKLPHRCYVGGYCQQSNLTSTISTISSTARGCHTRTKTACCQQQLQPTRHGLALSIAAPNPKKHHRICATAAPKRCCQQQMHNNRSVPASANIKGCHELKQTCVHRSVLSPAAPMLPQLQQGCCRLRMQRMV